MTWAGRIAQLRELNALAAAIAGRGPTTTVVAGEPGIEGAADC